MVRLDRFHLYSSADVLPPLSVPPRRSSALSTAPTGIALTTSEDRLLLSPAAPLTVTPGLSAIAVPSTPISATGATLGAVGFTVTSSVPLVVVDRLPSASFAVARSEEHTSELQ